jgi:Domain of unknown function (DUF4157)
MSRERGRRERNGDTEHGPEGAPNGVRSQVARRLGARLGPAIQAKDGTNQPPTIHDAATVAVEQRGAGATVDAGVAERVGSHLGADLSGVRVHDDPLSQDATAAMGARAFAYGGDVFLGPGERGDDLALMAHELTHVVQQGAAGQHAPQRKVHVGPADSPAEHEADQVAAAVVAGQPGAAAALLVDELPAAAGQMLKAQFIELLHAQVTAAAQDELGPVWSVVGCPIIERYFREYGGRPAREGEQLLRRFAPGAAQAHTAAEMIAPVVVRVREGVRTWRESGQLPADIAAAQPAAAAAMSQSSPAAHAKLAAPEMPADVVAALGPGERLDTGTASRMESAFGDSFADVRIHTDDGAARLAERHDARAFTVGSHIAFGANAYRPGVPEGDALLAHELAHVQQQQGASEAMPAGSESADEAGADQATVGVLGRLWGGLRGAFSGAPSPDGVRRSGLALRRCGTGDPAPAKGMDKARYAAIETRLSDLVTQKKGVVEGTGSGDMAAIDAEIDQLIVELRTDFGVRLDKGKILDAAVAGKDMLVVDGRIVLSPSGSQHYMGERLGCKLEVDHVPPGETLQIAWRWKSDPWAADEYHFLGVGPAFGDKTTLQEMELETSFWALVPPAVVEAKGMQILAHIYIGDVDQPTKTFHTGFISMPEQPFGDIKVFGAPTKVVTDQYLDLGIGPWTPDDHSHSIDWFVDGTKVAEDQLGLRRQFSDVGSHTVRADVSSVSRNFGISDKKVIKSAETSFQVMTADTFGTSFLDELDASPLRPKPVGLDKLVATGDESLGEIQHRVDQGGSQQPYWQDRLKAQKERLGKIREFAPDYATAKPLPEDPTKLDPGSYSGPITAALVMAESGGAQPLTVHLTIKGQDGAWTTRLIDSTSRKVLKYDGAGATPLEAYESVFEDWRTDNEYPTGGRIVHRFAPGGWTKGNGFDTYTTWKRAKEWVDGIITVGGLIVGALLLSDPDPTISKLLGGILMAAVVARSSVAIYERINNGGDVLSSENILDAVAIVTSFMGMTGGALRSAGLKAMNNPTIYRVGNWMIMGALAGDVGTFVYVSAEALAQLKIIQADPTLDDGKKAQEILRIMASLFVTGAMLIASNKELLRNGLKPTDFVSSKLEPGMKPELDVGARMDAEFELKQGGQWSKETSKLSDEALLDKVFNQRSRQEIATNLAKTAPEAEVKALVAAFGDDGMIALSKHAGDGLAEAVKAVGAKPIIDAKGKLGVAATGKLLKAVGGPGLEKVTAKADNVRLQMDPSGTSGSYRWGGTGVLEGALKAGGGRVPKTPDPKSGLRTIEAPDGSMKFSERGRYDDVRLDPNSLSAEDSAAIEKLFADFGITDPAVKGRVFEAIDNARVKNPSLDVPGAIKAEVRPVLKEAADRAKKSTDAGTPTTAEGLLKAQGDKTPLAPDTQMPFVAEAKAQIAAGILDDNAFKSARTVAEGRDAISQKVQADTGKARAEGTYGKSGGRMWTKIRFIGDLFVSKTGSDRFRRKSGDVVVGTDVAPDVDVAYLVEDGGVMKVQYVAGAKIVDPKGSAAAHADAVKQNARNKEAIEAGADRFHTTTRAGDTAWAEVKKVTGVDDTGAEQVLTGKLKWDPGAKTETMGSKGTTGFDTTMPVDAKSLDKVVEAIWRLAELAKRP